MTTENVRTRKIKIDGLLIVLKIPRFICDGESEEEISGAFMQKFSRIMPLMLANNTKSYVIRQIIVRHLVLRSNKVRHQTGYSIDPFLIHTVWGISRKR